MQNLIYFSTSRTILTRYE